MKHTPGSLLGVFTLLAFLLSACGRSIYYVAPREWNPPSKRDSIIQVYRSFLEGRRIFLDPGHGGEDRSGRGPAGDAIEADVNLRVALALRGYLRAAGAIVVLSRDKDTSIALTDRPQLGVRSGSEIFVSLHHNDTGTWDDITNYSSVYYHARPGHPDYFPANQDLARYIQRDMSYAMRNPSPPYSPTFDGTLSDFDIYPLAGFAVLRQNPLPAVLIEGSFFSHPHEERRLALTEFNAIEAWGIFIGIGKYFRAGIPALTLHSDSLTHDARTPLVIGVDPWTELDRRWIDARLDGREAPLTLNDSSQSITITPSQDLKSGPHTLTLAVKNRSGNSSWPFCKTITVMLAPAELHTVINPSILPPGGGATSRFVCTVQDSSGDPVADGTPVRVLAPPAGLDTVALTQKGKVVIYLTAPASEGAVTITASAGPRTITDSLIIRHGEIGYAGGVIQNRMNNATIGGATVSLIAGNAVEKIVDVTLEDGRYLIGDTLNDTLLLQVRRAGFFTVQRRLRDTLGGNANITLTPVASGVLHGRFYAIDPRFGGMETGDRSADGLTASRVNLAIARRLEELLTSGGATVSLIRSSDTTIAETERTKRSALLPRGMYIRIDAALPTIKTACEIYRNIQNQQLAEKILGALASSAGLDSSGVFRSSERFFNDIAMGTISVRLPSVSTGYFDQNKEQKIDRIAWGMFAGIVQQRGFDATHGSTYKVVDAGTGSPLPGVPVILDRTFTQLTDTAGTVTFFRLEQPDSNLLIPATHNAMLSKLP